MRTHAKLFTTMISYISIIHQKILPVHNHFHKQIIHTIPTTSIHKSSLHFNHMNKKIMHTIYKGNKEPLYI